MTATRSDFEPAYLKLHRTGELQRRAEELWAIMESCQLCPRRCGVNRLKGASGFCRAPGATLVVSSFHPHFGEERPLVGIGGSGTIFLTHCNLRCVFCQNWEISQLGRGVETSIAELSENLTKQAILEMHRQVGVARPPRDGIMRRGLMIRHLVMPNDVAGSEQVMEWIAEHLPKDTYVNIMAQYNPLFKAYDYPEIARRITGEEYGRVVRRAQELGLTNLDIQGYWWLER